MSIFEKTLYSSLHAKKIGDVCTHSVQLLGSRFRDQLRREKFKKESMIVGFYEIGVRSDISDMNRETACAWRKMNKDLSETKCTFCSKLEYATLKREPSSVAEACSKEL